MKMNNRSSKKCDCSVNEYAICHAIGYCNAQIVKRCIASIDGRRCNILLTENNSNGLDNMCNDCGEAYEIFLEHAEPVNTDKQK